MAAVAQTRQRSAVVDPCRAAFFGLGFVTLASQTVLLRELFSVLYGSDLAFAFALASWMVLSAGGALAASGRRVRPAGILLWGNGLYTVVGVAVFLAVRAWGAQEVIPFHAYLLIPVFLAPLCLLGGMLFPWYLADGALPPASAYGWEVGGGLAAGVVCAVLFHQGALGFPLLVGLVPLAAVWAWAGRTGRFAGCLLSGLVALGVAAASLGAPGQALECLSLRLRLRDGQVVEAASTPVASLVAVRSPSGLPAVYENGTPWPAADPTTARAAVAAVLWSLPSECRQAMIVHASRTGFEPVLRALSPAAFLRFIETDLAAAGFARRHLGTGGETSAPAAVPFDARALRAGGGGWDLAAVLSPSPGGLLLNRALTREFARRVRAELSATGVFVVALPVAPGFTHPGQEAWIDTVRRVLADEFPAACEFRTELGWTLLVGSVAPVAAGEAVARLRERLPSAGPGVLAEAQAVLQRQGTVSLDLLAERPLSAARRPVQREPPNRVGAPRAYFRYLQFRGHLVEEAPVWWRELFRERPIGWAAAVLAALCVTGWGGRRVRRVQGVFWAAWSATAALIFAVYVYQSLAGEAFWAVSLLSSASLFGILCGTRCPSWRPAASAAAVVGLIPAGLFPLYRVFEDLAGGLTLAGLLLAVWLCGAALGYVFGQRSRAESSPARGGVLFAVDLLGAGAGLVLGGVLLPWWSGFEASALLAGLAAAAMLALDAARA